jgi:response regulator of citrate/malate metabolism
MNLLFIKKDFKFDQYNKLFFKTVELPPNNFNEEIGNRIHSFLIGNLKNNIQTITIPISLTENYFEFSGLIFAHHVRLMRQEDFCDIPIVFYGGLELEQIIKLTPYARILLSDNVNYVNIDRYSFNQIQASLESYKSRPINLDQLVNNIHVDLPENYDSHHSITNEWALYRYTSLFESNFQDEKFIKLDKKVSELNYLKTLHFKYLEAINTRQRINKKKHCISPFINGIENKRIAIIDDEIDKGWFEFYDYVFSLNNSEIEVFKEFKRDNQKNILIDDLKTWADEIIRNKNIDLFIVDLRLHDDDFDEKKFELLSGIQLINFIKSKNSGIQIVVASASNKIWNFQNCMKYNVHHYAVKESPSSYSSRLETQASLNHFFNQIEEASQKSFLSKMYDDIQIIKQNNSLRSSKEKSSISFEKEVLGTNGLLDQLFNLIEINPFNDAILNHCLLICFQIFEKYCELDSVAIFDKQSAKICLLDNTLLRLHNASDDGKYILTKMRLIRGRLDIQIEESKDTIKSFEILDSFELYSGSRRLDFTALYKLISVLSFRHSISKSEIERIIQLRYFRSNVSAHLTGNVNSDVNINPNDIIFLIRIFQSIFILPCN